MEKCNQSTNIFPQLLPGSNIDEVGDVSTHSSTGVVLRHRVSDYIGNVVTNMNEVEFKGKGEEKSFSPIPVKRKSSRTSIKTLKKKDLDEDKENRRRRKKAKHDPETDAAAEVFFSPPYSDIPQIIITTCEENTNNSLSQQPSSTCQSPTVTTITHLEVNVPSYSNELVTNPSEQSCIDHLAPPVFSDVEDPILSPVKYQQSISVDMSSTVEDVDLFQVESHESMKIEDVESVEEDEVTELIVTSLKPTCVYFDEQTLLDILNFATVVYKELTLPSSANLNWYALCNVMKYYSSNVLSCTSCQGLMDQISSLKTQLKSNLTCTQCESFESELEVAVESWTDGLVLPKKQS